MRLVCAWGTWNESGVSGVPEMRVVCAWGTWNEGGVCLGCLD